MKYFLCDCGKKAEWAYMPSCDWYPYYCDECVPRGCSCNDEYEYEHEERQGEIKTVSINEIIAWYNKTGMKWIWKEEGKSISHVDELGRLLPCCEFWHDKNGWEASEDEINLFRNKNIEFKITEE